jgi:calcineurin-like phosphoesterase family protein
MIYFYSDPHFNDANVKAMRKNYIGDEEQVRRIRSKVGKNDTLIILGDVGDKEFLKKIRGYKALFLEIIMRALLSIKTM